MKTQKYIKILCIVICIYFVAGFNVDYTLKNKGYYKLNVQSDAVKKPTDSVIVSGTVFDLKTKQFLASSVFTIKDTKIGCLANQNGYFEKKIKAGTYKFVFTYVGNTTLITKNITLKMGSKYSFDVYMDSQIIYSK